MRGTVRIEAGWCRASVRAVALATLLLFCGLAAAEEPVAAPTYVIEQPPQALADALRAIARQTGTSVLFDPGVVNGRLARAVSGRLSAAEAIARAVEGTGLAADVMKDGAIVVRPAGNGGADDKRTESGDPLQPEAGDVQPAGGQLRIAQASVEGGPIAGRVPATDAKGGAQALQKIEITGSRLRRVESEGPVPVNVYTRDDIDRSGQPTLERFLSSLNEASMAQGEGAFGGTTGQGTVQLRGLPLGSTLVLINGRRVQAVGSSSANYFNLNLIPLAAVERVEVVPVGSSAVYGGDALAGVVNIILRKSIDGVSMNLQAGTGRGLGDHGFSLATGKRDELGSFLLLGSYSKSTPLTMAERSFFVDADYRRFGGPDARTRSCTPGTVSSTTSSNLPGLNATFAGIPTLAPGSALTVDSFAATAGQANLCNSLANGNGSALVHGTETFGLHASAERRLFESWSVFGELTYADDRLRAEEGGLVLSNVLVPATNPYNPFGAPVRVTARLGAENGLQAFERNTRFTRLLAGVRGDLGSGWDLEASASTSRDDGRRTRVNGNVNAAARTAALADPSVANALNPFTAGLAASEDVLHAIWSDSIRDNRGRRDQASAQVRGSLAEWRAGSVEAIAGVELSHDRYETSIPGDVSVSDSRNANAAYGELRIPLLRAERPGERSWSLAALTLAGRRDRYSDFGSANTYQAGIELRPVRTALLRASLATSFKPPTLLETNVDDESLAIEDFGLVDPARGNEAIAGAQVLRTTNHELRPERGKAYAFGAVWEPQEGAGTRLGINAWQVKIDGLIALLWPQVTLDNEALFPGYVTRGPSSGGTPGPVEQVLWAEVNFGSVSTAGVDLEASHAWRGAGGRWLAAASATRTRRYDVVIAPGAAAESRLGKRFADYWAPKWKGRLALGFDAGLWKLGLASRYIGAYEDAGTSTRRLGDFWVHDLSAGLDLKKIGVGLGTVKAASVALAVTNLGNRQPQFAETSPYYDVTQADWRGRYASVRLSVDW